MSVFDEVDKQIRREKIMYLLFIAGIFGYAMWDSYHSEHDILNYYWTLMGFMGLILYRLYKVEQKLDEVLSKLYTITQ
jgi:hypothetical protein